MKDYICAFVGVLLK